MQSDNRFFDDLAKILNGAAGTLAGMGREAETGMKERMRGFMGGMDFVSRDEFDAVKAMAAKARAEVDALTVRIAALESATPSKTATPKAAAKPAPAMTAKPMPSAKAKAAKKPPVAPVKKPKAQ